MKQIKPNTYAGECNICNQRAHIKCQRITIKSYKENKNKGNNARICKLCSKNEEETIEKIDINKLKYEDKPEKFKNIKTGKNELLILHLNARSVMNKIEEIHMICAQTKPDILCITETWLNDSVPLNAITPNGYKVIRHDRTEKFKQVYRRNKGGGVAIFLQRRSQH